VRSMHEICLSFDPRRGSTEIGTNALPDSLASGEPVELLPTSSEDHD
jgi:hypothetical protein